MVGKKQMEKDLVCGMSVDSSSALKSEHMGKTYYFCCDDCKKQFDSDPHKFVHGSMGHSHDGGGCC